MKAIRRLSERDKYAVTGSPLGALGSSAVALLVVVGLLLSLAACRDASAAAPHQVLSASANELRTVFNNDAGKDRVVMLVSPT